MWYVILYEINYKRVSIKTRLTHLEKKNRKSIQRHRKELISDTSKMSMENKIRCEHG